MTCQSRPRSWELVKDVGVDEEQVLAAGASNATAPSSLLMTSQQLAYPPFAESFNDLSWFSFDESRRDSFEQTDGRSSTTNNAVSTAANDEQETLSTSHSDTSLEAALSGFPLEPMYPLPRYYTAALSDADMDALVRGNQNHNLQPWSADDMVQYHAARKSLIPLVMPKVDKMNALAGIEHDKRYSQRAVDGDNNTKTTWSPLSPRKSHATSPLSACPDDSPQSSSLHARRRISPLASPSVPSSSSTHMRNPLAHETPFRLNPHVTFDAFLVPHKSGKGDILPGAATSKKKKSRKLCKMPFMPLLRRPGRLA